MMLKPVFACALVAASLALAPCAVFAEDKQPQAIPSDTTSVPSQSPASSSVPAQTAAQTASSDKLQELKDKQYAEGEEWKRHWEMSLYHWKSGQNDLAEQELKQAIAEAEKAGKPSLVPGLYSGLGAVYRSQKRYDDAIQANQHAIDLVKATPEPSKAELASFLNNIGETKLAQKQPDKALTYLLDAKTQATPDVPSYYQIMHNLGLAYYGLNQYPKAEEHFKKAITITETSAFTTPQDKAESMFSLTMLYVKQHRLEEASTYANKTLPLCKAAFGETNERTKMLEEIQRTVKEVQNSPAARWNRLMATATASMKTKNYTKAIPVYEQALAIVNKEEPGSQAQAITLYSLGSAYLYARQPAKAEKSLAQALPLYKKHFPKNPQEIQSIQSALTTIRSHSKAVQTQPAQKKS